jgi:hypothetical protein
MFSSNTTQESGGYQIQRSLRFNSADSAYLNRTPASAGNRRTWTWSAWVKRGSLTTVSGLTFFNQGGVSSNYTLARFTVSGNLDFQSYGTSAFNFQKISTAVYRDLSAWYHIVFVLDATNTQARIYVNGEEVAYSTNVNPANTDQLFNQAALNRIGYTTDNLLPFDGYMTEVNFIDGQALTPSSFGAFDSQTGVWGPIRYAGSYGTNGFYLNFSNNSNTTAATLGADYSGNGNNWTPNNFSVSAGAGNDSLVDVPTNWGVDTGVGGSVRGNYCTGNPLDVGSGITFSNGNLDYTGVTADQTARSTVGVATGKWYWEVTPTSATSRLAIGIVDAATSGNSAYVGQTATSYSYYSLNGNKYNNATNASYGATFDLNDVIGVALDMDAGTLVFYKNGTSQGTAYTGITGTKIPAVSNGVSSTQTCAFNFGQRPFAYTAPSGFKALNTQNLPTPTIGATPATQAGKFFNPVLYTGNGSARSISGVGFQPDWVWIKSRSGVFNHGLNDAVRGAGKFLYSDLTAAEGNFPTDFASFDSDGFSLGSATGNITNGSGQTYVAWNWKANGAGVTNTAGSITSTVSANTTSGFSIATFSLGATGSQTVGHGLGVAPRMIIIKNRTTPADFPGWYVYHASIGNGKYLTLNTTGAEVTTSTIWNNTSPTSSVFTLGSGWTSSNQGPTQVAYCFAEVPGYSRFGSYIGNGSTDGVFVFCGFKPAYVMIKCSSSSLPPGNADWRIYDSARNTSNVEDKILYANLSLAEDTIVSVDFLSNGFKLRQVNFSNVNAETYIFAAFASAPQKFALAR